MRSCWRIFKIVLMKVSNNRNNLGRPYGTLDFLDYCITLDFHPGLLLGHAYGIYVLMLQLAPWEMYICAVIPSGFIIRPCRWHL